MSDYISRGAIKDTMLRYGFKAPDMTVTEFVEDELPAADVRLVRTRWIPCSERLPEIGVTVLTLDKYKHVASRTRKSYVDGTPYFYPDGLEPGRHITHWMPLPELPKEGGAENG